LTINGKEITDKIFGKLWVNIYVSYDIPTTSKEKRDGEKKLTVSYALQNKPSIWNLDHPALDKMKVFFGLFHDSHP
jgi:hypothetical protein